MNPVEGWRARVRPRGLNPPILRDLRGATQPWVEAVDHGLDAAIAISPMFTSGPRSRDRKQLSKPVDSPSDSKLERPTRKFRRRRLRVAARRVCPKTAPRSEWSDPRKWRLGNQAVGRRTWSLTGRVPSYPEPTRIADDNDEHGIAEIVDVKGWPFPGRRHQRSSIPVTEPGSDGAVDSRSRSFKQLPLKSRGGGFTSYQKDVELIPALIAHVVNAGGRLRASRRGCAQDRDEPCTRSGLGATRFPPATPALVRHRGTPGFQIFLRVNVFSHRSHSRARVCPWGLKSRIGDSWRCSSAR
jgi:hypothetical protein